VSRFRVGVDTGGTFTDVVAIDAEHGTLFSSKTPSTPTDPSIGFMRGLERIGNRAGFGADAIQAVSHGTTVATNALLADTFPNLGLIVTRGFRAILEIARQSVPNGYGNSYFWVKPERIVPLHHVEEVTERLDFRGEVVTLLDEADARRAAARLVAQGITSIGVCFLHAYANGRHERRVRELISEHHPGVAVSISHEVLPEYREYERAVTTLVDAFVKPRVGTYLTQVQTRLERAVGTHLPFFIMKSNGGVVSPREVARQPITTVLSGPAAGALGAALLAGAAGFERVLTLDGGGTSTDVALIEKGAPTLTTEGRVGRFPVKVPMLDLVTVGTGGGSIASRGADGRLRVGPRSAGADPGPMCYAQGGSEPTLTDAALLLGRIPSRLLGGEIPLDVDLARKGVDQLATAVGLAPDATAVGVLELAAWSQANAVRQMTTRRGLDVRDYHLVAFGGSGPLLSGTLIDVLGLPGALVPVNPGNVSAFGLLAVDLRNDYVVTSVQRDDRLDSAHFGALFAQLEDEANAALRREGFTAHHGRVVRSADLRYVGQASEVRVDVPAGPFDRVLADRAVDRFHAAHERAYGYSYWPQSGARPEPQLVEWVNLRVTAIGPLPRPRLAELPAGDGDVERALTSRRAVRFGAAWVETPVFARSKLGAGDRVPGPAIVEEFGSTTVVNPSLVARVDRYGNLLLAPEL
jgi:N-methylhydantoinase A